jgi:hypothetical protein
MIILLSVIASVIAGVPLAAVVLVTVATRQEETARSIAGRAPGPLARAARRLLAFHAVGISRPASRGGATSQEWQDWQDCQDGQADDPVEDDLALAGGPAPVGGGRPRS